MKTAEYLAPEILHRCQGMVTPSLHVAVDRLHPLIADQAKYAFGWVDGHGRPAADDHGKGLRPALAILAAQAVGAPAEHAVPAAVSVELVHAFSLIHDDIMDGDERRRNRASVWKMFGVASAVLAGDGLLALGLDVLGRQPDCGAASSALLTATLVDMVNGQAADIAFEDRPWTGLGAISIEEYKQMAANKTGALLGCAAGLGALVGGASADVVARMAALGRELGLVFQAVDDVLGIWGDPAVTGKPSLNDLRRRKKTLPVIAALACNRAATRELAALLTRPQTVRPTEAEARQMADAVENAGGRMVATALAEHHLAEACRIINELDLRPVPATELVATAQFLARRLF